MKSIFFFCILGSLFYLFGGIDAQPKTFDRMKREIIADILHLADGIEEDRLSDSAVEESVKERSEADPQIQDFERKKRAIIEAFIDEAEKMDEEDVKNEEMTDENLYEVLRSLIDDAHKIEEFQNEEVKPVQQEIKTQVEVLSDDGKKDDLEVNLGENTLEENQNIIDNNVNKGIDIRKEESDMIRFILRKVFILPHFLAPNNPLPRFPGIPHHHHHQLPGPRESHVLHCRGHAGSQCVRGVCSVACPGGAKVQIFCVSNSVVVKNTGIDETNTSKVEVSCG